MYIMVAKRRFRKRVFRKKPMSMVRKRTYKPRITRKRLYPSYFYKQMREIADLQVPVASGQMAYSLGFSPIQLPD